MQKYVKIGTLITSVVLASTLIVSCSNNKNSDDNNANNSEENVSNNVDNDNVGVDLDDNESESNDKTEIVSVVNSYYDVLRTQKEVDTMEVLEILDTSARKMEEGIDNQDELFASLEKTTGVKVDDYFYTPNLSVDEKIELSFSMIEGRNRLAIDGSLSEDSIIIDGDTATVESVEKFVLPEGYSSNNPDIQIETGENTVYRTMGMVKTSNGWRIDYEAFTDPYSVKQEPTLKTQ